MHTEIIHAWERWKYTEPWNLYKIYKGYPNKIMLHLHKIQNYGTYNIFF